MKKTLWLIILFLGPLMLRSQTFEGIFDNNPQVDMVIITPEMFDLINEVNTDPERSAFFKGLSYFGMFTSTDKTASDQINREAEKYARDKNMKLLLKTKDTAKETLFYYTPGQQKGHAREIVLLIYYPGSNKARLWHIKGDINLKKISLLALQRTQIDTGILKEAEKKVQ